MLKNTVYILSLFFILSCSHKEGPAIVNAKDILGNADYLAISYGGYRHGNRDLQPTIQELQEDMQLLAAMGVKVLRTYNVHYPHAANILEAIHLLKQEDPNFEMYVMLGAWIDCENAWTNAPNHTAESPRNTVEIKEVVTLANKYPDIVKMIAVGNEAMVKWAWSYYVEPKIILKWVSYLQELKKLGKLGKDVWITSSDNFASWGGGSKDYHVADLERLMKAVDFISMHTYPMHDTHYNPEFWGVTTSENTLSKEKKIEAAMLRAKAYAVSQYEGVEKYMLSLGVDKPIHIGETGWASVSNSFYGDDGTKATDEYKQALYYKYMRNWTNTKNMSCFYFEAFDEQWKDPENAQGSENHFGLINVKSQAKYALWDMVDQGVFKGLTRNGKPITKTYDGNISELINEIKTPDVNKGLTN